MSRARSAEFALLLACCRWPQSVASRDEIAARARDIDWARFVRLAARHRVEGMVWKALTGAGVDLPEFAGNALGAAAMRIAHQNLMLAAEAVQLDRLFRQARLSPLFIKGVTLGRLVYGDIARKSGWDIDLLVASADIGRAAEILSGRGYVLATPHTDSPIDDLARWHRYAKESVWRTASSDIWVELHSALSDNPALLSGVGVGSPRQSVEVSPGLCLQTLAQDELVAYLAVHGASSAWFRLKWIADFAALLSPQPAGEIERLYRRSLELGAGRAAAMALLLADTLFGLAIPPMLRRELRADRVNRLLVAIALRKLHGRTGEIELDQVVFGTASIHAAQLGLMQGWRFKRATLSRMLVSPIDRITTPLPAAFAWFYPLLQAARLIRERTRKAGA